MPQPTTPDPSRSPQPHAYYRLQIAAIALLVAGTVVYHILEKWSWVDSLYFSTVALTTVGFGDLTPTSDAAKLFTVGYLLSGVTILVTYLNARLERRSHR
ncbi:potassium channel family protein [Gordonia rhizosphera]|uniref:Potassium channel domain-containing protein n=1 Tax=Gordonia rhizosphera NBRC 16068 TaxID=1108045 RepID=K6V7P0_9ACTN|nr:potassium channel family protein [Gordonia rhizosphera]GAB92243.1 hypothetical protein GORHZ_168_00410 [Gordonia rhizosphera NBRC 16068]